MAPGEWGIGIGEVGREKRRSMALKESAGGEKLGKDQG
jgi:hypothetical protein